MEEFLRPYVGTKVEVLCRDGANMRGRTLLAVSSTGVVISGEGGWGWAATPWVNVEYVVPNGTTN